MPFRGKKTGSATRHAAEPPASAAQLPPTEQSSAGAQQTPDGQAPPRLLPDPADPPVNGQAGIDDGSVKRGSRRGLRNWRVRSRLLLLISIPTLTALVFAGFSIASSVQNYRVYQRVEQLAKLSGKITTLVQDLQNERLDTVKFIVLATPDGRLAALAGHSTAQPEQQLLANDYAITDGLTRQVRQEAAGIGSGYPAQVQQDAQSVVSAIDGLTNLRAAATHTQLPAVVAIQEYATTINELLALNDQISAGSSDAVLANTVRVVGLISSMKEEVSQQQAYLTSGLNSDLVTAGHFSAGQLQAITAAEVDQQSDQTQFDAAATPAQRQLLNNALSGSAVGLVQAQEQQAIALASNPSSLTSDPTISDASSGASAIVQSVRSVEQQLVNSVISRSVSLRNRAITSALLIGAATLLLLALALLATVVVGRSMIRPLHRLRSGALEVAGVLLPQAVRRISETEGEEVSLDVVPINVDSTDEIGEVARAFDQVHREALRLAGNEAAVRGNVNAMFVNLSRRTQSLVQRQIHLIDDLEQGEQDSERLGSLFRLDHLATRMRRNSENLLVLAGHDASQRWSQPVALVDVLRAAVSEIEQYERISLNVQPGIAIRGQVVNDVVHLLAELLENATSFSSAEAYVNVSGHLLNSGGVLLDVTDRGVGMPADEMKDANWRLDNPPVVDVAVSRRMGLFVVARLASKHGIRVRLRPGPTGGITALIWLPDETVTYEASEGPSGLQQFGVDPTSSPGYPPVNAADGGSSRAAAVAAARVPRFTAFGPGDGEGPPDLDGERTDHSEPAQAFGGAITGAANGLGGASPAYDTGLSSEDDGASSAGGTDQADRDQWEGTEAQDDPEARFRLTPRVGSWAQDSPSGEVIVSGAVNAGEDNRLPIFESVESDWFRRGRHEAISGRPDQGEQTHGTAKIANGWSSPADEGWQAADSVESPSAAGVTPAGLPKRVPRANLVPGGVAESKEAYVPGPARSAAATRQRMASFQRGTREGRATLRGDESPGTESEEDE